MNPAAATTVAFTASLIVMGGYGLRVFLGLRARARRECRKMEGGGPDPPGPSASTAEVKPISRVKAS